MVILINRKVLKAVFLIITVFLLSLVLFLFDYHNSSKDAMVIRLDDASRRDLEKTLNLLFAKRNHAIIQADINALSALYDKSLPTGRWAFEAAEKRLKYMHQWGKKQGVIFTDINSHIVLRGAKKKKEGFSVNLLVSSEYLYHYVDTPNVIDSFRIGTYHSLEIMPNDGWLITREWYTDPFADSLEMDDVKREESRNIIMSKEKKDLSDIKEERIRAVEYADRYCGAASLPQYGFKYNPKYRDYNSLGGDCANFASQILYEAGGFTKNRTWNYERGAGSRVWLNAAAFNYYMLNSGRASLIAYGTYEEVLEFTYKLLPGDYIAYEVNGKVTHISIVTGFDSKGYPLVNSHNTDRYRVPWDLGWSNKGIRFHIVRVHY